MSHENHPALRNLASCPDFPVGPPRSPLIPVTAPLSANATAAAVAASHHHPGSVLSQHSPTAAGFQLESWLAAAAAAAAAGRSAGSGTTASALINAASLPGFLPHSSASIYPSYLMPQLLLGPQLGFYRRPEEEVGMEQSKFLNGRGGTGEEEEEKELDVGGDEGSGGGGDGRHIGCSGYQNCRSEVKGESM